ncbi:MAG: altronate dehydratase family protein [Candidatus Marinimicrobia bacterium]|nr:altronate dehydratase family protein [Candidatus Neomarinimicrobiota bacterium]
MRLHPKDNVGLALTEVKKNSTFENTVALFTIPAGHKIALNEIKAGEAILKYNQTIGFAAQTILAGDHVHTHNIELRDFERIPISNLTTNNSANNSVSKYLHSGETGSFKGYLRPNGKVGTRNYVGILSTVNCSATVCQRIADNFKEDILASYPNADGVIALTHDSGCGMSIEGDGLALLQRVLIGYAEHPNFAGILIVGLGCEVNQVTALLEKFKLKDRQHIRKLVIQENGGTRKTIENGIKIVRKLLEGTKDFQRETVSAKHLCIGLECGGSDAYSGISANPALGAAADLVVEHGGSVILSETPEIYGAEHLLIQRAVTPEVGNRLTDLIHWWENYVAIYQVSLKNNPSPGNKAGGISTILEKSLGAVAKGGTSELVDVIQYAEPIKTKGLVFMDSPGYDPVSVTGQVASGANVVCFTTGRGSVFGCKPVPCLKLATNSPMYNRMIEDMDLNCGEIIDGTKNVQEMGSIIFQRILATASGELTKSEEFGFGDYEFTPWKIGAVL